MDRKKLQEIVDYLLNKIYPPNITKSEKLTIRRRAVHFEVSDGKLYHICTKKNGSRLKCMVVSSSQEAYEIFTKFHTNTEDVHCGINKTYEAIMQRYYWPSMFGLVKKWISECPKCQQEQMEMKDVSAKYIHIMASEPWELVGLDLIGDLTRTSNANQYICVITDYFSKWIEAFPLKTNSVSEVANCIVRIYYRYGAPKHILTDQGTEFTNQVSKFVCKVLDVKHSFLSTFHPQKNGFHENLNRIIKKSFKELVMINPKTWDQHLDAHLFDLRTKKQITTNYSPYTMLFGREARYASDVPRHYEVKDDVIEELVAGEIVPDHLKSRGKLLTEKQNKTAQEITSVKRKLKKTCLSHPKKVLRRRLGSPKRDDGPLGASLLGPFTVIEYNEKAATVEDDSEDDVSLDHLKEIEESAERTQNKMDENNTAASLTGTSSFFLLTQEIFQ